MNLKTHMVGKTVKNNPQDIADAVRQMMLFVEAGALIGPVRAEVRYRHDTMAEECVLCLEYGTRAEEDDEDPGVVPVTEDTVLI